MNIHYFFIIDCVKSGELKISYCPNTDMVTYHFTKLLQRNELCKFWALIMIIDPNIADCDMSWDRLIDHSPQECVGHNENQKHVRFSKDTKPHSGICKTKKMRYRIRRQHPTSDVKIQWRIQNDSWGIM